MKTKIWILLLISVSSIITATSNETTPASVEFAMSLAKLTKHNLKQNTSDIAFKKHIFPLKMLSTLVPTTPSTTRESSSVSSLVSSSSSLSLFTPTTNSDVGLNSALYRTNSGRQKTLDESSKYKRAAVADSSALSLCDKFSKVNTASRMLYSPNYPELYPNKSNCVVVLEAPAGHLIQLDFRDHFNIEPSDECKFDYLEIRDGAHGFSSKLGQFCGHSFPDIITSRDRWLWLHFNSDENIEYNGFKIVYDFIPRPTSLVYDEEGCHIEVDGDEGWINSTDIPKEKKSFIVEHNLQLDCMWVIKVKEGWKIQLLFINFKLKNPNECDSNFVDVFKDQTNIPSRLQNFCGSIADSVTSENNILHIRYFAEAAAIDSTFEILYTAFRDKAPGGTCAADEYDCEDNTCISLALQCNKRINCRFRWDEESCEEDIGEQSEHIIIIVIVFGIILSCMVIVFVVNCMRKIIRDHKVIREHIRQSRESKLDELGRHSTKLTKSRENIAMAQLTKIPPPAFDPESPSSMNLIENNMTNHQYYREGTMSGGHKNGARIDSKNDLNIREQEIKTILGSSYDDDRHINDSEMCDMACQTRESLFQPVFKNKVTQSPCPLPGNLRFSTFGYDSSTPSPPPPPVSHIPMHQNQHNIQASSVMVGTGSCPTHSQQSKNSLPHQHHQHHHHYHHLQDQANLNRDENRKTATSKIEMNDFGGMTDDDAKHKKYVLKKDETQARSFSDIRKSAPDVIIISGCNTSH